MFPGSLAKKSVMVRAVPVRGSIANDKTMMHNRFI
jgi:hypothetical protein